MAREVSSIRVRVYDGPHHGRILVIPSNARHIMLPNPMPAGEMWGPGRSQPETFKDKEYTYEVRTANSGTPYLAYVEAKRVTYQIPVAPSIKLSPAAISSVRLLRDEAFNYGIGDNAPANERYAMMMRAEKAVVEYISRLEQRVNASEYGGARITQSAEVRY